MITFGSVILWVVGLKRGLNDLSTRNPSVAHGTPDTPGSYSPEVIQGARLRDELTRRATIIVSHISTEYV